MTMRCAAVVVLSAGLSGVAVAADGLRPPADDSVWPRWQLRAQVAPPAPVPLALSRTDAGSLLGDYYFPDAPGLKVRSLVGGLRATGGLAFTGRGLPLGTPATLRLGTATAPATPFADDAADTLPYVGLGYSATTRDGAWRFSADVGLVADRAGGLSAGRLLQGEQTLDNALRELRLAPVLQLGVRYSF